MPEAVLKLAFAGPQITIQDGGRSGAMRFGVPASGAMDRKALAIANTALGNAAGAAGLEISLGGLVLDCVQGSLWLAVAGAGFIVEVDGDRQGSWGLFRLSAGQRLSIRRGPWGSWTYLCFKGTLAAREWLGSAATHALSGLGGGRLVTGDMLRVADTGGNPLRQGPLPCPVFARPRAVLHAVPGPQHRFFAPSALDDLTQTPYRLTSAYDRMGVRLSGHSLTPIGALSISSEPILRGSVQVSGDGVPTVLLADHQTTGGYPKIATVVADDLDGFVQCRVHQAIQFRLIAPTTAISIARQRARAFAAYLAALSKPDSAA